MVIKNERNIDKIFILNNFWENYMFEVLCHSIIGFKPWDMGSIMRFDDRQWVLLVTIAALPITTLLYS